MKIRKAPADLFSPNPETGKETNTARLGFPRGVRPFHAPGFALIITLSLSVLLTVLSLGLLSLSSISLRAGGRGDAAAQARANARMALMFAIGELQKEAGPDTRVTARADILKEDNPPVLGVWKSWGGEDHDSQGRPTSPGNYKSAKDNRFLAWLVSTGPDSLPDTSEGNDTVPLLGKGSVGDGAGRGKLQIHLKPTEITDATGKGGLAWWVSGENQKARLPKPSKPSQSNSGRWSVVAKSHSVADPSSFRMERLFSDAAPADKAISLLQSDFVGTASNLKISQEFFHDLSTSSVGLLTNSATGGWRKDLSLLTENWTSIPSSSLPFFRGAPDKDIMFAKPTSGNPTAAKSMIYPWASYRGSGGEMPIYRHGPVSSWENLKDYATAYKRISTNSSGKSRLATSSFAIDDVAGTFNFLHKVRILPVVARIQWIFSHSAAAVTTPVAGMQPRLLLTPVITMWNPYSVELTAPPISLTLPKPLPVALKYTINGAENALYNCLTAGSTNNLPSMSAAGTLSYNITTSFTLKPGETRIFSPVAGSIVDAATALTLTQGYRAKGGHYFPVVGADGKPMAVSGTASIKAKAKFDTTYSDMSEGVGVYMDMKVNGSASPHLAYRMIYTPSVANELYPPLDGLGSAALNTAAGTPVPFLSTIFGARMASKTHIPAKGFVQSSPLVNYTAMGSKDVVETTIRRHYLGTNHPVNSPFDYSFIALSPNDSNLPNQSDTTGRGYIVTGFNKGDGLSRCVIAEIPTRPIISLGELQNWDMRYDNPIPPYAFNLIGNSDATPLVPSNAVVDSSNAGLATNLQYDDSYCANHILFDDWFFSSIAPDPDTFGTSGDNMQKAYTDFVSGTDPLGNEAYKPIGADSAAAAGGDATALYNDYVKGATSWKTIASRLEVEGMFNVNSTSLTAWRALLGHARNQQIPYMQESGTSWNVELSGETDHAYSRFAIAGDVEAGTSGSSGAFTAASEFAGYRVLDDGLIDELAEAIVKQVRARGPFLSLSEFVNRQLSSGDLALAGAVQTALNEMANSGGSNPFSTLESMSAPSVAVPKRAAEAEYRFPAAAVGRSAYGLPGWTRQADVLRPIAPILSARDDTFTIRAHGDARDENGKIVSRMVCEAVVQRTRDYVDPAEAPELATPVTSTINKKFGRRFEIVSFRWLSPSEI